MQFWAEFCFIDFFKQHTFIQKRSVTYDSVVLERIHFELLSILDFCDYDLA